MTEATALLESACAHLEILNTTQDFDSVYVGSIRAEMAAAEVDLTEALTILESISYEYLSLEEREGMDALKVICQVDIDLCEMVRGDFCDFVDHCQKASLATDGGAAIDHLREAKTALVRMKDKISLMRTKIDAIDVDALPSDIKGDFVGVKIFIQEFDKSLEEWIAMMDQVLNVPGP
ncbi:hypothetical protein E2N92_09145 [Methanofollis formosanus]|uniref:Uncharacterized protein n=1 Tax=Methanofollis formosanus TaxID=299308 RepID=A0A8G1A390_9EURY|nr:hypothetical protein [Methanofollis formosanus]QYZ79584.1 hypothetical protein E2N92_09145 [Methanofollis formosanus]